ncbi:hypothetical protein [Arthrobacter bambusae]|uniref:hypothetical protein n=1 Tax=Arthrobacter bambusae TaxID=1338426 RepID=UPI00277F1870|nr:hypothetical protein [Arthrobacter bambusae]MDQ0030158.1 hypothetical protein [Arthrobacter bambusae]MDQ0097840.1 hypothetical protein [Arthrobacter bambusae]
MTENSTAPKTPADPAQPIYQAPAQYAPYQQKPRAPKIRNWKRFALPAALVIGGIALGAGVGFATRPAPVVEVQTNTETKDVNVDVTPASCLDALDQADNVVLDDAKAIGFMNDALKSASRLDAAGITSANDGLTPLLADQTVVLKKYTSARDSCRASK